MCHVYHLSRTELRTMSDGDICSDDKKYGGFGAMMANSLRCQEECQEERERRAARSRSVFATKTALRWALTSCQRAPRWQPAIRTPFLLGR